MWLAHAPRDINLGKVVRSIKSDFDLVECFATSSQCTLTARYRLASLLGGALQYFPTHLDGFMLADLLPGTDLPLAAGRRSKVERRKAP